MIAFRCDGDREVGAGHVARCARIATAFRAGGHPVVMCGRHEGVALALLDAAGLTRAEPTGHGPLGVPVETTAIVVDSYAIPVAEVERAAASLPVAVVADGTEAAAVTAVLSYHLDAVTRLAVPGGATPLLGPDYAPASPTGVAARHPRGTATALVTAGGGEAGFALATQAATTLLALDDSLEVFVAAPGSAPFQDPRLRWGVEAGLDGRIAWADLAVSAAGSTPYDLACAGVPAAIRAVAPNQEPIERAFLSAGLARDEPADLLDPAVRATLAAAGPALIDGYGAFRARDGLLAAFAGHETAEPVRYRPAGEADRDLLLEWRNEEHVRAMSRTADPVEPADHGRWLASVLADPERTLLVAERAGTPAGTVRFDRAGADSEISVTVAPGARGAGLGTRMIAEATELELAAHPHLSAVLAEVQVRNLGSLDAFRRAGFLQTGTAPDSDNVLLARTRSAGSRDAREQEHQ